MNVWTESVQAIFLDLFSVRDQVVDILRRVCECCQFDRSMWQRIASPILTF